MTEKQSLAQKINANLDTGRVTEAKLATDDRVLARITDGIYRQPASALRELIANAYDADATTVIIQTDAPKFSTVSIRDDGNGLTVDALDNLINHIGGSPKRTKAGVDLGVVNEKDASLSPAGRRLIGKIGIGLFSVAQLTRHFQIITKTKGSKHRIVAEVMLKTYTEDDLASLKSQDKVEFETGTVRIQAFPAEKWAAHGTEIILLDLKQQTKDLLRSQDIWLRIEGDGAADAPLLVGAPEPPKYHIGRLKPDNEEILRVKESLPWDPDDAPDKRFAKLYQAVVDQVGIGESTPKLETLLDNYLRMLWTLSLSAPIDYIDSHPFDLTSEDDPAYYLLSNSVRGQASKINLRKGETLRDKLTLVAPERGVKAPFRIVMDEIELRRPIRFNDLPQTSQAVKKPMLFVGKCAPDLSSIPRELRGGDLEFEGYLLWTPKVVPKENVGLQVRISDASGTGFDDSFLKYQISEQTRLRQITAEIFVLKGLDPALNIDRESFNFAHPHYQYLMKWVHNALRQLANTQKSAATEVRTKEKESRKAEKSHKIDEKIAEEVRNVAGDPDADIPEVVFVPGDNEEIAEQRTKGVLAFDPEVVFGPLPTPERKGSSKQTEREIFEAKIKGVAQLLEAYGVFEDMPYGKQQELLRAIVAVFASGE